MCWLLIATSISTRRAIGKCLQIEQANTTRVKDNLSHKLLPQSDKDVICEKYFFSLVER
jgi:hypothetical protein